MAVAMGIDVGGRAKGFDVAVVSSESEVLSLVNRCSGGDVLDLVGRNEPAVVGIDAPCSCAEPWTKSRPGERRLAREICPIFYTPPEEVVRSGHTFYSWMAEGLDLYEALRSRYPHVQLIEVFPSAAWTVWAGPRDGRPKALWSSLALKRFGANGVPKRCSQDARDAIGAALVASQHFAGQTIDYGGIAVPQARSVALAT